MSDKEYNLSQFLDTQKESKKQAYIVLGENRWLIKKSAWSILQINTIHEKHSKDPVTFVKKIIAEFLGNEALQFIENNVNEIGKLEVVNAILKHQGLTEEMAGSTKK